MDGLSNGANDFDEGKPWTNDLDSEEWTHLHKSSQNVNQLLVKIEENVEKSFEEISSRKTETGMKRFLLRVFFTLRTRKSYGVLKSLK